MAIYNDLITAGNTSGWHCFDAAVIQALIVQFNLEEVLIANTGDGPLVLLRDAHGQKTQRLRNLLIHWEGRLVRNDLIDVVKVWIGDLDTVPGAMQDPLATYEQVPYGRRVGNRPPQDK